MKPTLVFLHGGPGFRDYLQPFFEPLQQTFNCIFYDQARGPEISVRDLTDELHAIISSCDSDIVLIGHSWGAVLAIEYVALYPDKIAGLVLMNTGLNAVQWKDEFRKELKSLGLEHAQPEEVFLTPDEQASGKALLDKTWSTFSAETFESLNEGYLVDFNLFEKIEAIQVPILNIFSTKDVRFPPRVGQSFRALNPQVVDLEIVGAGHFPILKPKNRDAIVEFILSKFK